ncbi:hypothetical protein ERO13_A02G080000v2 [Gossypium hirsutum]|uniref:Amino acid transporter AVT6A n=4 Tax=Gossypium TaxID=3633 RepID=A0A1U8NUA3_GOSHI|nr:amino acid transporter AVT6A [Gossypium hirsutum]KAB2093295.1 hypothetical protein ES319_A02G087100v1 [Gossypium barbadense]KAG4211006.1 hypothetical protein ERO13_A02G080000v2 [Gossypium hirsutum]TYH27787.1 hypothetical protein ES288_A02G096400v1 [Gossypium darwinii]TYJ45960.1 hypothetical protein E1A91_A02G090700v1 [Gossypium mustelinum]
MKMNIMPSFSDSKHRRSPRGEALLPQKQGYRVLETPEAGFDGASTSGAIFNLSTTVVGAGIMALPATVNQLGLIPGLFAIIFVSMLTGSSIDKILRFSRASKSATYSGVAADAFGGTGRNILQVCIVINNLGMLVVYMIIIGDVLSGTWEDGFHHKGVMEEWFGEHWWTTRSALLMFTTLFVFAPFISFKRVDSLRYTSALSVGFVIVFVAITAGVTIVKLMEGKIEMPRLMPKLENQASFWKLFTTVPVLVTAYICHHNVLPIANELRDPTQMKLIVRKSLMFCSSLYIATSFFGLVLFGDHILDDVLANFDGDLGIPYSLLLDDLIRVSYGLHLMLVFPIVFFSLRLNVDGLLFPYAIPIAFSEKRFFSMTVALMGFIFMGANFIPSIWDAFQFTGATAAVCVGYIFPAAITLRDTHGIATKKDRLISWMMIFLAVSTSTVAVTSDIYGILTVDKGVIT